MIHNLSRIPEKQLWQWRRDVERGFIRFYSIILRSIQMKFEEGELGCSNSPQGKSKLLGVIVLTDNRRANLHQKTPIPDYRCSGFKETEGDPLESAFNQNTCGFEDSLLSELARRVSNLEERVKMMDSNSALANVQYRTETIPLKRKNRRKFKDLLRDQKCPHCQKIYGSDTSLKCHLKLKHSPQHHPSQSN